MINPNRKKKPNRGRIPTFAPGSGDPFVKDEYAREVISTLKRKENLIIEAPAGTGRRAAYLTTIIEYAKANSKRVLIACATRDLKADLIQHILPALQEALPCSFSFGELGIRDDYLCQARLARETEEGTLNIVDDYNDIYIHDAVVAWARRTSTGIRTELPYSIPKRIWKRLSCPANQCSGEACQFHAQCHAEAAYRESAEHDILVCDYAFLYKTIQYLSFPLTSEAKDHPLHGIDIAVLEEPIWAATQGKEHTGFTIDVDEFRFATRLLPEIGEHGLWANVVGEYDFFLRHLRTVRGSNQYSGSLTRPNMFPTLSLIQALKQARQKMQDWRRRFYDQPNRDCTLTAELDQAIHACQLLEWRIDTVRTLRNPNFVITIHDDFRGFPSLHARPQDVSHITAPLFEHLDSVIVTSTAMPSSTIQKIKNELGANPCRMVVVQPQDAESSTPSPKKTAGFTSQPLTQNGAQQ